MAQLTDFQRLGVFLAVECFLIFAIHAIFIDPVVADTAERESTEQEIETIGKIEAEARSKIEFGGRPDDFYERDAHPTPHGCVQAHWIVDKNLEARFRHGVLAEPGRRYRAWVRFSNGLRADDRQLDVRGMAIKLMGVDGDKLLPEQRHEKTQDFVMINYHTFVVSDVDEFLPFLRYQVDGNPFGYFIGWNPFKWKLREMRVGLQMLGASFLKRDGPSPLSMSYFSMLPYKLGSDLNIKFSVWPCDPDNSARCVAPDTGRPQNPSSQFLREQLIEGLRPRADARAQNTPAARFEFRVQVQRPNKNMPIENASIEWSQSDSPYIRVAELTIAPQRFSTEAQNRFCENLSFTPWHALPAHEPIGGLNRARKVVYDGISKARHDHNKVERHEPRGFCLSLNGQSCDASVAAGGQR